jgi:hypothetical protein
MIMKNRFIVLLFVLLLFPLVVSAHDPSGLDLAIDPANNLLTVKVDHPVSDGPTHYIRRIEVVVDNQTPVGVDIFFQKANIVEYSMNISDIAKAKTIKITAYSGQGGSLEKEFNVKETLGLKDDFESLSEPIALEPVVQDTPSRSPEPGPARSSKAEEPSYD